MYEDQRLYENQAVNDNDIHSIVQSCLVHNCFKDTVKSFIASTGMVQSTDFLDGMEKRKRIFSYVTEGNALKAIELTQQLAPDLLETNKDLHFDLLSLHFVVTPSVKGTLRYRNVPLTGGVTFVVLVGSRKCTEALEFAQTKLTPFGNVQKYVEKLEVFMALLAYEEPDKSPMFRLLGSEYRQQIPMPNYPVIQSALERLIQHATLVRRCISQEPSKEGIPPFTLKDFLMS